ncbi:hypothetical protein EYF80_066857 [Liparis tanakae]|uniref:Uncharacterized protein n=1 Tax=Liparis tanakae TaxID=230148 RepID=A0A4Z2E2A3_9TELE|nr:hypothetical protein EYF80_066857 [Liparis tanakae]
MFPVRFPDASPGGVELDGLYVPQQSAKAKQPRKSSQRVCSLCSPACRVHCGASLALRHPDVIAQRLYAPPRSGCLQGSLPRVRSADRGGVRRTPVTNTSAPFCD